MSPLAGGLACGLGGASEEDPVTAESIRDRAIDVIEALPPAQLPRNAFRAYRNEGSADFQTWAETNPAACFRRFQVRSNGAFDAPEVSNTDIEEHRVTLVVLVAYPHDNRAGKQAGLDRDDLMDADMRAIVKAIGPVGRANFASPYPDACWLMDGSDVPARREGNGVDFIEITYQYSYQLEL